MQNKQVKILLLAAAGIFSSCEEEVSPGSRFYERQLVVECYLEAGNESLPPYCILTNSLAFDSLQSEDLVSSLYVRGAEVIVSDGTRNVSLQEFCLNDLQEPFRSELLSQLGYNPDSVQVDFCAYIDISRELDLAEGKSYALEIRSGQTVYKSAAVMPASSPIDSIWFEKPPGRNQNDSFAQLFCIIEDNPLAADYYRYFTAGQGEPLIPNLNSVTDDVFFNGKSFEFSLAKARDPDEEFGDNTGLYRRGDSIRIKWCNLPKEHYEFWNALEAGRTRQGPFSAYVRVPGNVPGALGIFGTQHCIHYTAYVPK